MSSHEPIMKNETRYLSVSRVAPLVWSLAVLSPIAYAQAPAPASLNPTADAEITLPTIPDVQTNNLTPSEQVAKTENDEATAQARGNAAAPDTQKKAEAAGLASPSLPSPPAPNVETTKRLGDVRLAASAEATETTLEEAIILTLQNSPQRAATRAALEAALARIGNAKADGGLQLGINGSVFGTHNYGKTDSNNINLGGGGGNFNFTDKTTHNESLGLTADLPIYNGGRVKSSKRVAEFNARAQAAQTLQVEQDLVLQATNAYLNVLRSDQLLKVADSNLAVSRERQRVSTVRYEAGASARLDVYRSNTTLADAQQRRIAAVNEAGRARADLNSLMGRLPQEPLQLEPIDQLSLRIPLPEEVNETARAGKPSGTLLELQRIAVENRPQGDVSRNSVFAADAQIGVAKAQRKPSFGLSFSNILRNPASIVGRFAATLGLSVAQTLFDSGRGKAQIREAKSLAEQARANFDLEVLGIANQIETSLVNIDTAQGQLDSAQASVSEAQAALAASQLGYEAGANTVLDVNDAQTALLTQQTNTVNARFNLASAQAQLSSNVGVLTDEGKNAYQQAIKEEQTRTKSPKSKQTEAEIKARRERLGIPVLK
jgi:outer membrane protein